MEERKVNDNGRCHPARVTTAVTKELPNANLILQYMPEKHKPPIRRHPKTSKLPGGFVPLHCVRSHAEHKQEVNPMITQHKHRAIELIHPIHNVPAVAIVQGEWLQNDQPIGLMLQFADGHSCTMTWDEIEAANTDEVEEVASV